MPFNNPRQCAGCHRLFHGDPVFVQDTAFCCSSCAAGALCSCFAEADLADDGVNGLGLPFAEPSRELVDADAPVRVG